ncbi:hypothetical protein IJG79_02985 [Candidatus Saccharibacteria bacterium]|nr:hypothetical protein [Candidatus Saccharibacteria bacterium]
MADYVLIRKSRNVISSILHVILNILLGVGSIAITVITGSWILGLILVLISKWRIFAVRPRYWWLNIMSSLVDLIVGASFVLIAFCSGRSWLIVHTILAMAYTLWLIFLKPRSSELAAEMQSLIAVFLGTTAVTMLFASSDSIFMVISCFFIGFAASRHLLVQADDNEFGLLTYSCGLVAAEIAWMCNSWLIVYTFGNTGIIVPQLSVILTIFAFISGRVYRSSIKHDGKIQLSEITTPLIFSILVVVMLVIWFSNPIFDVIDG